MSDAIVHLSSIASAPLLDSAGERLGRIEDVVARLDQADRDPAVVGLVARIGGREMFVPIDRVERLERAAARTATTKLNLAQFERRPGEVLLRADVLDHSLINVRNATLVTARDVEITCDDGTWRVTGVDPTFRVKLYRLLPRRLHGHDTEHAELVPWHDVEAFVGHVPSSRLKLGSMRLRRLHPAQIADLVEAASHQEGEEILEAVGEDKELEADVFEELDDDHQIEYLRERSDEQVAEILEQDGERRRRRSAPRDPAGPSGRRPQPPAGRKTAQGDAAARLQPVDRWRADEPRFRLGSSEFDGRRRA